MTALMMMKIMFATTMMMMMKIVDGETEGQTEGFCRKLEYEMLFRRQATPSWAENAYSQLVRCALAGLAYS